MNYTELLNNLINESGMQQKEILLRCKEMGEEVTQSYLSNLKTINGKTVIYKISEWNDWGVQYYDGEYHEIYDIPCPVCHGFHDPIKIESITEITADEISNTYIKECKKCGAKEPIKSTVTYK